MSLKFQHRNVPLITLLREMVTCSILLCTRMSGWQKSLSLTLWTQFTSQSFSTHWIMLEVGIFRTRLTGTDWGGFRSLASELILPRIQINSGEETDKAHRLSTSKITLSDLNNDLPGLQSRLKHKRGLRKLCHVTRDPACKAAVNWFATPIRRMTRREALERRPRHSSSG
jgi:hypothetical protein